MLEWLTAYLGPLVKARFPEILVMLYDHNKKGAGQNTITLLPHLFISAPPRTSAASYNWALPLLTNETALQYIDGVALHW